MANISESSVEARDLCVELFDVGGGLERNVTASIDFIQSGFSNSSKL